jgi:hypothetical protein
LIAISQLRLKRKHTFYFKKNFPTRKISPARKLKLSGLPICLLTQ